MALTSGIVWPADTGTSADTTGGRAPVDFAFLLGAAILVFTMQAGFAMVEAGFTRAKNTVAILMKNVVDFVVSSIFFFIVGFGLMFGQTTSADGWYGTDGFLLTGFFPENHAWGAGGTAYDAQAWTYAFFFYQMMFAGTAATIVSGAMAERTKFAAYLCYCFFVSILIYPVFGSWVWGSAFAGSGWLEALPGSILHKLDLPGFKDFAGSTVVHSIGGWCALAGAIMVGPRLGKYRPDGMPNAIPGHSMSLATLGTFLLWIGWFGFNGGSTLGITGGGDQLLGGHGKAAAYILVNTSLAGAAGFFLAMIVTMFKFGKADLGLSLNGTLAGMVAITAGCSNVKPGAALAIGAIAGILVVFSVLFFDRIGIDDPVGAISVHLVNGIWGTLAAGLFDATGTVSIGVQVLGIVAAFLWAFPLMLLFFALLNRLMGLRVSPEEEENGLDLYEHGAVAYIYDDLQND